MVGRSMLGDLFHLMAAVGDDAKVERRRRVKERGKDSCEMNESASENRKWWLPI